MGLKNEIAQFAAKRFVEHLNKTDPALHVFFDACNEMTIFEAWALYRDKKKQEYLSEPTSFRAFKDASPAIDYGNYVVRFTREPFTVVMKDLIAEFKVDEFFDVSLPELLLSASEVGEDKK
jgi:hypothetical protein